MLAPMIWYFLSKLISVYFPNRLLLSFLVVFAFPIACDKTTSCHQVSFSIYLNDVTSHFRTVRCLGEFRAPGPVKSYLCDGIGCQDFVFDSCLTSRFAYNSKIPHGVPSRHRLTSSRFPADND